MPKAETVSPVPGRSGAGQIVMPLMDQRRLDASSESIDTRRGDIETSLIPAVNVACVPQRSPLRYPGGKTWLVPHIRAWLGTDPRHARRLVEPFVGGGIVSLTAVMEGLVERCMMVELDPDVAAFWKAVLHRGPELRNLILDFRPTRENVLALTASEPGDVLERGFRALVLNRTRRGGILAPGASLARAGEGGKGVASRWYPRTITDRIRAIEGVAHRIEFQAGDGITALERVLSHDCERTAVFIDPPYTAEGKKAGRRLYRHHQLDHKRVFELLAKSVAPFLMTYDRSPEILRLVKAHGFHAVQVVMKTTHHTLLPELVITRTPVFAP